MKILFKEIYENLIDKLLEKKNDLIQPAAPLVLLLLPPPLVGAPTSSIGHSAAKYFN